MEEAGGFGSKGVRGWVIQAIILVGLFCVVTPLTSSDGRNPTVDKLKIRSFLNNFNKTYINGLSCCGSIPMHTDPDGELTKALNNMKGFVDKMNKMNRNRVDSLEEPLGVAVGVVAMQVLLGIVVCCALRRCAGRSVDRRGALVRGQHITVQMGSESVNAQRPPQSAPIWASHQADTQQSLVTVTCHRPAEPTAQLLLAPQGNDPLRK